MRCDECPKAKQLQTGIYRCPYDPGTPYYGFHGCNRHELAALPSARTLVKETGQVLQNRDNTEAFHTSVGARTIIHRPAPWFMEHEAYYIRCGVCGTERGPLTRSERFAFPVTYGWERNELATQETEWTCQACCAHIAEGFSIGKTEEPSPQEVTEPEVLRGQLWRLKEEEDLYAVVTMVGVDGYVYFMLFDRETLTGHGPRPRSPAAFKALYELVEEPELEPGATVALPLPSTGKWVLGMYLDTLNPENFHAPLRIRYGTNIHRRCRGEIVCLGKP